VRKRSLVLTEAEQRLMEVLWARRSATVSEAQTALAPSHRAAFNTVQTTLRILERKGYVEHRAEGRAFRYVPVVDREAASTGAVQQVLRRFFNGAPGELAINLLERAELKDDELARIERLVADARAGR
jgi:predicted transcriptional regulator